MWSRGQGSNGRGHPGFLRDCGYRKTCFIASEILPLRGYRLGGYGLKGLGVRGI
jgi:hypothetical protein